MTALRPPRGWLVGGVFCAQCATAIGNPVKPPGAAASPAAAPIVVSAGAGNTSQVFASGTCGYKSFRIPALLAVPSEEGCHVLAFAEGRVHRGRDHGEVHVVLRRSADGGASWGDLQVIARAQDFELDNGATVGNPCPIWDAQRQRVVLLLTTNLGTDTEFMIISGRATGTREVWVLRSATLGATWDTPRNITANAKAATWSWYATGPGAGVQLANGRLVAPCDHAEQRQGPAAVVAAALNPTVPFLPVGRSTMFSWVRRLTGGRGFGYASHLIFSDDGGETWAIGGVAVSDTNECTLAVQPSGALLVNMRDFSLLHRRRMQHSTDGGVTLQLPAPFDETLPDPPCQASICGAPPSSSLPQGGVFFCNPNHHSARRKLTIQFRPWLDEAGQELIVGGWRTALTVEEGKSAYSSLALLTGTSSEIGCLYECGEGSKPTIEFVAVPLGVFAQ